MRNSAEKYSISKNRITYILTRREEYQVLLQINDTLISLVVYIAGKEKKIIGFSSLPNKRIIVWRKERGRTSLCCR